MLQLWPNYVFTFIPFDLWLIYVFTFIPFQ